MKKVLLIGDSIRMGYDKYVKLALEDCAEVYYPEENCRFTPFVLRYLHEWLGRSGFGEDTDCLHWNVGLWDLLELFDDGPAVPIEMYEFYLHRICRRIKRFFPKAEVIFATSTPVDEAGYTKPQDVRRENRVIEQYNEVAVKVVTQYGFHVNDLYGFLKDKPLSWHSDKTHYYTKDATKALTDQVLSCIGKYIDITPKEIDYTTFFPENKKEIGF